MYIVTLKLNCGYKQMSYKKTGATLFVSDFEWENLEKQKPTAVNFSTVI